MQSFGLAIADSGNIWPSGKRGASGAAQSPIRQEVRMEKNIKKTAAVTPVRAKRPERFYLWTILSEFLKTINSVRFER
jgi:hypothetical protein